MDFSKSNVNYLTHLHLFSPSRVNSISNDGLILGEMGQTEVVPRTPRRPQQFLLQGV